MKWFGEPWPRADWRAPVCKDDADRIPAPNNECCVLCNEMIEPNDRGVQYAGSVVLIDGEPTGTGPVYAHAECNLRSVTGNHIHVAGQCKSIGDCNNRSTLTYREEALKVWEMWGVEENA